MSGAENRQLLGLVEDLLGGRNAIRSVALIRALIQIIVKSWQEQFAKNVVMKFNCFFLVPFIDSFPSHLRSEVQRIYANEEANLALQRERETQVAKERLLRTRNTLMAECDSNMDLQQQFSSILTALSLQQGKQQHHDVGGYDESLMTHPQSSSEIADDDAAATTPPIQSLRKPADKKRRVSLRSPYNFRMHSPVTNTMGDSL